MGECNHPECAPCIYNSIVASYEAEKNDKYAIKRGLKRAQINTILVLYSVLVCAVNNA